MKARAYLTTGTDRVVIGGMRMVIMRKFGELFSLQVDGNDPCFLLLGKNNIFIRSEKTEERVEYRENESSWG